jgi:hypothetical protein
MSSIPILTINEYNLKNEKPIGTITVSSVSTKIYPDLEPGKWIAFDFSDLLGGKSKTFTSSLNDAINDAKDKFNTELSKKYPNATSVIGLKFSLSTEMLYAEDRSIITFSIGPQGPPPIIIVVMSGTVIGPL